MRVNDQCVDTLTHCSASKREPDRDDELPAGLAPLAQPQVPTAAHAQVVVDEADGRHAHDRAPSA